MAFLPPLALPRPRSISISRPRHRLVCLHPPPHSIDNLLEKLRHTPPTPLPSRVHLIGVGPGNPNLLTLSSLHHLRTAHVILYDRLITPSILKLIPPSVLMIYVGKQSGLHTRSQDDIQLLLAYFAAMDRKVVRVKGGDPMIFGRGGEEMHYLSKRGVEVSVQPGISAATGIAADLQVPLTMRGVADEVRFVTGHACEERKLHVDLSQRVTYVIYMGLGQMRSLMKLFEHLGMDLPVLAVERGTTPQQRALAAPLDVICDLVEEEQFESPTLIIVGHVVKFCRVWGAGEVVNGLLSEPQFTEDSINAGIKLLQETNNGLNFVI